MSGEQRRSVTISTRLDGTFEDIAINEGGLAAALAAGTYSWTDPILLYGPDCSAEIDALIRSKKQTDWIHIQGFRDLTGRRRGEFFEMEGRLDSRFYEHVSGNARARLANMLKGDAPLEDLIEFVAIGPSGQGLLSQSDVGQHFTDWVERLCNTTGMILPWQMKNSFLPAFVYAVWQRHPRLHPLILHFPKRFGIPTGAGIEVATSGIPFEALAAEAERVFKMSKADVEKAYRVWQLSRVGDTTKPQATTPKSITREVAREFLNVAARARTDRPVGVVAPQKPAPLMFELEDGSVGLKQGVAVPDSAAVVKAGAATLARRVARLQHDASFGNVVPSSTEMLSLISEMIAEVESGEYSDATIIELGLELHALQWHVDPVKQQLGDVSLGELTGLFATANLFLGRFTVWQDYLGNSGPSLKPDAPDTAFDLARQLLEGARHGTAFLTPEANARIEVVLCRAASDNEAPPIREGLVRSGENLAAVTAEGLSRVVLDQAKQFGGKTKEKAYEQASEALVSYATKAAPLLLRLGEIRHWPWLTWLQQLVR